MLSRKEIKTYIFITIGLILVALGASYFSEENKYERMKQEFSETMQRVEENIKRDKIQEEERRQSARKREQKTRLYHMQLSTAFEEGRCDDFLALLDFKAPLYISGRLLQADLYMRGKCYTQDFSKAFELYNVALQNIYNSHSDSTTTRPIFFEYYYGHIAHIKFRLAALYWRGQGVRQDKKRATKLSKEASIILGPWYAKQSQLPLEPELGTPNIWNMSDVEVLENVTFSTTGPWDMPEPLSQQIKWLKEIYATGGKAYLDVGLHILQGTGGYEKNPAIAYEWIYVASHIFNYGPAHYPRAMLIRDEDFYELKKQFPVFSLEFNLPREGVVMINRPNRLLLRAVKAKDVRAESVLLRFYQQTPAYYNQQSDIYFWMLKMYQRGDSEITEEMLENAQMKLKKFEIESVEKDIKEDRFPSHSILPKN